MSNESLYYDYFRQMAISHKDLRHDPDTEAGGGEMGNRRFACVSNGEIMASLRTQMSFPALLVQPYDLGLKCETVHDIRQRPKGAFMVVDHAKEADAIDEQRAYDVCEKIMFDILKKAWRDHYGPDADSCSRPFKSISFNMEITRTGKLFDNEYGWYVLFDFEFQQAIDITQKPEDGTFI